jgi:hypothetical protein
MYKKIAAWKFEFVSEEKFHIHQYIFGAPQVYLNLVNFYGDLKCFAHYFSKSEPADGSGHI